MPNYRKMTMQQLFEEYRKASAFTAEGLKTMAEIWMALVNKGADLAAYKTPLSRIYPDIASGKMLPGTALLFGLMPTPIVDAVSTLVPEIQAEVTKNEGRVEVLNSDGKTTRNTRIQDLSQREISQVIGGGKIRSISEQRRNLAAPPVTRRPRVEAQPEMRNGAADFDVYKHMTAEQHAAVMRSAEAVGLRPYEFIIDALVRNKLVPGKPIPRRASRGAARSEARV